MAIKMTPVYALDGSRTEEGVERGVPLLPAQVALTCERKEIDLATLVHDPLMGVWYPRDGWKGMFLGIEADGHAHT